MWQESPYAGFLHPQRCHRGLCRFPDYQSTEDTGQIIDDDSAFASVRSSLRIGGCLARWPLYLPDLRSRLNAQPAATIAEPDDASALGGYPFALSYHADSAGGCV